MISKGATPKPVRPTGPAQPAGLPSMAQRCPRKGRKERRP